MNHFWLSFCDASLPKGSQFLGVVLVDDATDLADAITQTWAAKANPGGEVSSMGFTDDMAPAEFLTAYRAAPKLTLLSLAQLKEYALDPVQPEKDV